LPQIESKIEGTVEENVVIKGKVILPKSSVIKAGTYIEGNVVIGENTEVGPYASLRSNVTIGDHSKVGFAVEVKNSVIGHHTFLSHLIYVGDSLIGNHVNIAGGCMIANWRHDTKTIQTPIKGKMTDTLREKFGAVIGDHVKLGVNTSIYPGRKIWPGLTTRPGAVVDRDLTE
jgi:bifunctional UDP-N-acetylglucosamine pyrophosphorylase/glucosamine-1-phosphate N-acetyltransferase